MSWGYGLSGIDPIGSSLGRPSETGHSGRRYGSRALPEPARRATASVFVIEAQAERKSEIQRPDNSEMVPVAFWPPKYDGQTPLLVVVFGGQAYLRPLARQSRPAANPWRPFADQKRSPVLQDLRFAITAAGNGFEIRTILPSATVRLLAPDGRERAQLQYD